MGRFHCLRRIRCQCHVCIHHATKPTARSLIRPVATVRGSVTEELSPNADDGGLLPAGKLPRVAQFLGKAHPGESLPRLGFPVTVVDKLAPVTTLLLHVKGETRRTPDGLQTLKNVKIKRVDVLGLNSSPTESVHWTTSLQLVFPVCSRKSSSLRLSAQSVFE